MNIIDKIKALFSLNKAISNIKEAYKMDSTVKPGYKTTEFWLTVITNIVTVIGAIKGLIPANVATIALTVLNAIYGVIRTLAKSNAPDLPA